MPTSPKPKATPGISLSREDLYERVWSRPLVRLAAEFGLSGNGLAKICDRLLIPHPPRGYWSKASGHSAPRPPLPPLPAQSAENITISRERAHSRRLRTRKPIEARRDQIMTAAADIVRREGLNAISMKRVAREVGISEALIYTYFSSLADLLVELARAEIAQMTASQEAEMARFTDYVERARASASGYLRYVARRGGLLQILLSNPGARAALRSEYRARRELSTRSMARNISAGYGLPLDEASVGANMLRAVPVRAGALLAAGKIDLATAERLSRAVADGGRDRLIAAAKRADAMTEDRPPMADGPG
jgi:AcrR family transcriptional regulator